jgi:hypothetical protein
MSNERKLSFESIDEQIEKYVQMQNTRDRASQAERWWFAIGLFAIGVCMPIGTYVGGIAGVRVLQAGIAVECLGLGLSLMLMVRREWKTFVESRRTFAKELDQDFRKYREYVNWLRKFPRKDIQQRLRFIEARRNTMMYRMGLFTGGFERLGVIPVLVVLYVQFKDWKFGDWDALGKVNVVGGLMLWALLLCYLGSWWLVGLRSRIEAYETLMREAVVEEA